MSSAITPKKMDLDGLAALFVNRCLARSLPTEALRAALDAITLWKGLQAEYDIYATHQNAIVIHPDEVAELLPEGEWAKLRPETRKKLRAAIREQAKHHRQGLAAIRQLIFTQASSGNAGSQAFQAAYAERLQQYLTEPITETPAADASAASTELV